MLAGKRIAVPESRQLDIMAQLLEKRGASVLRVPLVAILDAPNPGPVLEWMQAFIASPPDLLILLTGEGVRRLLALAEKEGLQDDFVKALSQTPKLCRGPKPVRALTEIGLRGEVPALEPTTEGVIKTLEGMSLEGKRVGVQLYGSDPNLKLTDFLDSRSAAPLTVAPYIYADKSHETLVVQLIHELAAGEVDAIAFTSQPQYKRLQQVAKAASMEEELRAGLTKTAVAAVGPVVRDQLEAAGVRVDIMPERTYFMKPLVSAIVKYLA